tara:strand:+ start:549 stop:896 length:348 start_codon:yes stop_codon:yes gene_type:complete
MINAGNHRHRITIEKENTEADGSGGFQTPTGEDAWLPLMTVWASIKTLNSQESFFAVQISPTQTHEIRMRYRPGITQAMRVKFGTRVLNILGVRNIDERNEELVLRCEELPAVAT